LGVHIRRTDALIDAQRGLGPGSGARLDQELEAALTIRLNEGQWKAVVLACDDEATTRHWRTWLAAKDIRIIYHEKSWATTALRQTSLADAATDLFLLSRCGAVLASIMGSFAWMASTMGGAPLQVVSGRTRDIAVI
jgi:hypothetical protein